ncbi:MAG: hypothetical protein RHS_1268 [Robinsoniella sp. RHS]|nr:MAG: hypothetical protein RHS_1268 [Robinsoniella sp. RHS]
MDSMSQKNTEENKERSMLRELLSMLLYIAIVLVVTFLIVHFVGQRTQVDGSSMYPTLENRDNLITDKITYRFKDPERFDIIVFPYQHADHTYYIKRIIGLPGDTVQVIDGKVYINGEDLNEHYGRETIDDPGTAAEPITLGDDEYFVMGDNRNNSSDSRDPNVGLIHRKDIIGRAWLRIWPFSKFGFLKHQ